MGSRGSSSELRTAGGSARYAGQDVRPTSGREVLGWYAYAFAAETYVVCGIGSFIPILLETLARENGVLLHDHTTPCGASYRPGDGDGQCVVHLFGVDINTASFAMYTFSLSVLLQAVLVISISCAADHGTYRKTLLLAFAWLGAAAVMGFLVIDKSTYLLGALLAIVSNTAFGASFVLLNSFLPLLVRHHPAIHRPPVRPAGSVDFSAVAGHSPPPDSPLVSSNETGLLDNLDHAAASVVVDELEASVMERQLALSTNISARGVGIGYLAGLFVQCIAIAIVVAGRSSTFSQRVALFVVGAWWAVFTIPAAVWLRPRPGPPLPLLQSHDRSRARVWLAYVGFAWVSLIRTVRRTRHLVDIVFFLTGWFLLSDAIATTSSTAILFAKTELHMTPWSLGMINVVSTMAGVVGAFAWAPLSRLLRLQLRQTILACIGLFDLIPLYGLLAYIPIVQRWQVLGLQQPWEMYPLAAVFGFVIGGLSSYCRSLYGELIPPGSEAAFYALYAITDKGSSMFGPAIVAAIIGRAGHIRPAFWFLLVLVTLPAGLICFVDIARGKRAAAAAADRSRDGVGAVEALRHPAEGRAILAAFANDEHRLLGSIDDDNDDPTVTE